MDLSLFSKQFGTEKQCLDFLFQLRWADGYRCPRCQCRDMWAIKEYKYKCKKCGYQTTVISGTLFQDTHIPLTSWFRAAWYISSNPNEVSAVELQKDLALGSYRTALLMINKLKHAMLRTELCKLKGTIEVSVTVVRLYAQKNKTAFLAIATETDGKKVGRIRVNKIDYSSPEELNRFIEDVVEPGSKIIAKDVLDYVRLAAKGYIAANRADTYIFRYTSQIQNKIQAVLKNASNEIPLDQQLNEYCAFFNSQKTPIAFDELIKNAVSMSPLPYAKDKKSPDR